MKITLELTGRAACLVAELLATGLFGRTEADVVERLACERLRQIEGEKTL